MIEENKEYEKQLNNISQRQAIRDALDRANDSMTVKVPLKDVKYSSPFAVINCDEAPDLPKIKQRHKSVANSQLQKLENNHIAHFVQKKERARGK